jgi:hypothetical protein
MSKKKKGREFMSFCGQFVRGEVGRKPCQQIAYQTSVFEDDSIVGGEVGQKPCQ